MSQPAQDPPLTEMPLNVDAPGPNVAIDIFDDAIEYHDWVSSISFIILKKIRTSLSTSCLGEGPPGQVLVLGTVDLKLKSCD